MSLIFTKLLKTFLVVAGAAVCIDYYPLIMADISSIFMIIHDKQGIWQCQQDDDIEYLIRNLIWRILSSQAFVVMVIA